MSFNIINNNDNNALKEKIYNDLKLKNSKLVSKVVLIIN